jgi:hypothetical protein
MKIKNLFIATFSVALLASCGGSEMCDCAETQLEIYKAVKDAKGDEGKMKEIEETYKDDMEACAKVAEEYAKELEGMSEEEQEAKEKEEMENCDAMQEMEKMMKEDMGM